MKIGELAERAGVNIQTVRYYERRQLLADPGRTRAGYRQYDEHDLLQLRFILRAKALGFTLTEIHELLALRIDPGRTADDVRARALEKLADTEHRIRELERIRAALLGLVESCAAHGAVAECALIHAIASTEQG